MKILRNIIIILLILITATVIALVASRQIILNKFKIFLVEKMESASRGGITIGNLGYVPIKGIHLLNVTFYKDTLHKEKVFYIPSLYIKFPFKKLILNKTFSPTVAIDNLQLRDMSLSGSFDFSMNLAQKIKTPEDSLEAIQNIGLRNFSLKSKALNIKNINGDFDVTPKYIKTTDLRFILNDEPCTLSLEVADPLGEPSSTVKIFSSRFNIVSQLKKEVEIYEIQEIKGTFLNSSFNFIGELESVKNPVLSLYGKADVAIDDIAYFAPDELKESMKNLNLEGKVSNSIYFKGNLKNIPACELGLKSDADYIKIQNFKIDKFHMEAGIKDGVLNIPLLSAYPYNGVLASSMALDLTDEFKPYQVRGKLSGIDIAAILENTELGKRGIKGKFFSEFAIKGDAKNASSTEGNGKIFVNEANLGPMPLLTPLIGNLFGYFQGIFPEVKKIYITKGTCDFYIANRKVLTDNLVLWGDAVSIHAKGYIDFDKNLNFDVENRLQEPEKAEGDDWQARLREMIVRFGKLMSKARLTGTLEKPKWKFQYLEGVQDILKGGLEKALKGIFE